MIIIITFFFQQDIFQNPIWFAKYDEDVLFYVRQKLISWWSSSSSFFPSNRIFFQARSVCRNMMMTSYSKFDKSKYDDDLHHADFFFSRGLPWPRKGHIHFIILIMLLRWPDITNIPLILTEHDDDVILSISMKPEYHDDITIIFLSSAAWLYSYPPILLQHDDDDDVVLFSNMQKRNIMMMKYVG